jgi:hypothetical protein
MSSDDDSEPSTVSDSSDSSTGSTSDSSSDNSSDSSSDDPPPPLPPPPWSDCDASGSGSPATKTGKPNYLSNNVWFCYGEVEAFGDYAAVFPDTAHSDWGQLAREGYPVEINYKSTSVECVLYCHLQVLKPKSQRKSVVWDDGFKVVESKKITRCAMQ